MIVGGYSLDLYCDNPQCCDNPAYFEGGTASECRKQARRAGWELDLAARTAICPACRGTRK